MGSICLSSAPNLRCFPLSKNEYIAIIVPTSVEILFSTYLIYASRGAGRKNLLLVAEGWFYFALALLEMLLHILPAARDSLNISRIIDITLGAASSVPLLLYTLFLFLFTSTETLQVVPVRFQRVGKALLILFIPLILASNAVASFVGITHELDGRIPAIQVVNELIHTFFSSFALALLTAYQATNFSFAFLRLATAFINSRRIERDSADEVVLFKGTGWINAGLKFGAIETVIGFATPSFGTSLVRRIFRLLARGCLIIGLVKGVDFSEDFRILQDEMTSRSKSKKGLRRSLRPFISNPRLSTFRQLSPTATSFYQGTRSPLTGSSGRGVSGMDTFAAIKETVEKQRSNQRVTIHFDAASGRAPTLEMRFSTLDMPNPALIVDTVKSRPTSEWVTSSVRHTSSSWYSPSAETGLSPHNPFSFDEIPMLAPAQAGAVALKRAATMPNSPGGATEKSYMPSLSIRNAFMNMSTTDLGHSRGLSDISSYSLSRSVVNEFPEIPQPPSREDLRKAIRGEPSAIIKSGTLSASSSLKRKPVPVYIPEPLDPFEDEDGDQERPGTVAGETPLQTGAVTEYTFGSPDDNDSPDLNTASASASGLFWHRQMGSSSLTTPISAVDNRSPFKNDFVEDVNSAPYTRAVASSSFNSSRLSASVPSGGRIVSISPSEMLPLPPVEEDSRSSSVLGGSAPASPLVFDSSGRALPESAVFPKDTRRNSSSSRSQLRQYRGRSMETIDLSWFNNAGPRRLEGVRDSLNTYEGEVKVERATRTHQSKPSLARIKSVGKAPRRYTPTPERTGFVTRGSVYVEPIVIPSRDRKMSEVEAVQGSVDSEGWGGALRDSSVFGGDVYVRRY